MVNLREILKEIGLKENETTIYLASLSIGSQPASILGMKSNISRSNTQYICTKLVKKGLLNSIETKLGNIYSPEEPEKIISMLGKEYNILDKKMEKAHSIVSELKNIKNPNLKVPKVKYFTGIDGIINMFEDMLKDRKTIYGALDINNYKNIELKNYIYNSYIPKRISLGIKTKAIVNYSTFGKEYINKDSIRNKITLLVPYENYLFSSDINIYGNKTAFYSFNDLSGIIIENENIKDTMFSLFKGIWNLGRRLEVNKHYKNELI